MKLLTLLSKELDREFSKPGSGSWVWALGKVANSPGVTSSPVTWGCSSDDLSLARGHGHGRKALSFSATSTKKPVPGNSGKRRLTGRSETSPRLMETLDQ